MVRPNPVPPYFRVIELSAWMKASKSWSWIVGEIPMPVSSTRNKSSAVFCVIDPQFTETIICPFSVNLNALDTRLIKTCFRRKGSVMTRKGTSGENSTLYLIFFSLISRRIPRPLGVVRGNRFYQIACSW